MRLFAVLFVCALAVEAQPVLPQISFSGEGAESLRSSAGKVIGGVQLVNATICNGAAGIVTFSGGLVYQQASAAGFQPIGPNELRLMLTRSAALNWRTTLATASPLVVGTGTALVGSQVLCPRCSSSVQKTLTVSGSIATGQLGVFQMWIKGRAPDPTSTLANLIDVTGNQFATYTLAPATCMDGKIGAKYPK